MKTAGAEEIMLAAEVAEVTSKDLWRKEGSEGGRCDVNSSAGA